MIAPELNKEYKIHGQKWVPVFNDLNTDKTLAVSYSKIRRCYDEEWKDFSDFTTPWREPHRHESVVWVGENPACYGNALVSSFFGFTINEVTSKKTDVCNRKFKVTCEEILE